MNISSTTSRLPGVIPGSLRENDADSTGKPDAFGGATNAATPSSPASRPSDVAAPAQAPESSFSASDAQAALQVALRALASRPDAAIAAQAPASPSAVLGLLEVA